MIREMARKKGKMIWILVGVMIAALSSCSVSRHLPENGYLLDRVRVLSEEDQTLVSSLKSKVKQKPNTRFLGLFRWPLRVYCLAGNEDNAVNRLLKKMGEEIWVTSEKGEGSEFSFTIQTASEATAAAQIT